MSGEPAFFELGVEDAGRARTFYGALFGWSFGPGPSGGDGAVIRTPTVPGGLHAGDPAASPALFFRVDDLDAATATVRRLGGTVEGSSDPDPDPDLDLGVEPSPEDGRETDIAHGRFAMCRDDQGSPFGLVEPPRGHRAAPHGDVTPAAGPSVDVDVVTLERAGWEALSTGPAEATAFYDAVLAATAVMLLPGGLVLTDRAQVIASMSGPPWSSHRLSDVTVLEPAPGTALVHYAARATRGDVEYAALCASLYVRQHGTWRLVSHQQTPG
ncbi:DUF4440 domain-containing protein [Cellulomonas sp. ATA003]|uniref:DUF4440 domain-containing protein n=1 Tax=Cellulomonas sp. ATA003 TaxID=3073064 RepID=UPI002873AEEA|nr:DUF4440 domain-containing protein [Cellulomonas sp. ATA003]WNB85542.1 DUF4440 domain-containing protein [Cellulomonas sp. ATA003]